MLRPIDLKNTGETYFETATMMVLRGDVTTTAVITSQKISKLAYND
ncbi:hypothetical protein KAI46_04290 [bacterium]|nr:hypothetical protein [bacterium]